MNKTTTLIYHEWADLFEEMPPEDVKTVLLALLRYDASGEKQEVSFQNKLVSAIYKMMLDKTENNRTVYFDKCEQNRINGAKGGAPKGNQNAAKQPKTTQNNPKQPDRIGLDGIGKEKIGIDRIGEGGGGMDITPPTSAQLTEIVDAWNKQTCTGNIVGIHEGSERWENTVKSMNGDFEGLLRIIQSLDEQEWFADRARRNDPVRFDWFIRPDSYQKVAEGNYRYLKAHEETAQERSLRLLQED